ncbi:hypothetical protein pb186bvf_003393 [Paramecium bursaria]
MYDKAIQIEPNNIHAYFNKGMKQYQFQAKTLEQQRNYLQALEVILFKQRQYLHQISNLLMHLARTYDALKMYEKILLINSNNQEALFKQGQYFQEKALLMLKVKKSSLID